MIASLKPLVEDNKWRVRLELIRCIADLAPKVNVNLINIQNEDIFLKHLEPLYIFYLADRAHAIRKSGVEKLSEISKAYGKGWLSSFFNRLSDIVTKEGSYHFKITALYSLTKICK